MKKKAPKLHLHRETLRALDEATFGEVAGVSGPATCLTCNCTRVPPPSGCECPNPGTQFCV